MEQLILHAIGDYITQTNWMANEKTKAERNSGSGSIAPLLYYDKPPI